MRAFARALLLLRTRNTWPQPTLNACPLSLSPRRAHNNNNNNNNNNNQQQVIDRNVEHLSGGELQRFAIGVVAAQAADVYMIDEPSSYLDVRQRLKVRVEVVRVRCARGVAAAAAAAAAACH